MRLISKFENTMLTTCILFGIGVKFAGKAALLNRGPILVDFSSYYSHINKTRTLRLFLSVNFIFFFELKIIQKYCSLYF